MILEGALERLVGACEILLRLVTGVEAVHPVGPAQTRPGRRESGILLETLEIQIPRYRPGRRARAELVRSQIELVGLRARRHVLLRRALPAHSEGGGQRVDDPAGQLVLQGEDVTQLHLGGLGPEHGSARCLDELGVHAELVAGPQQGPGQQDIDVCLSRDRLEIRCLASEPRRRNTRPDDERVDTRQGGGEVVGQTEGQKIGLGVGAENAKRQHHQPCHRHRARGVSAVCYLHRGAQVVGHRLDRLIALSGVLAQRLVHDAIDRRDGGRPTEDRRLLVRHRVHDLRYRFAAERRLSAQHLEEHRAGGEDVASGIHRLAEQLFRREVVGGADEGARHSEVGLGPVRCGRDRSREPEVEQL